MELIKILGLNKGCVLSIVGSGGKTTFMYTLANELRHQAKVLMTTTTKIYVPEKEHFDYLVLGKENLEIIKDKKLNGIYVLGNDINSEYKLIGMNIPYKEQLRYFDYILIEADGSKKKPIKGWNASEPVITHDTTMTVGLVSFTVVGRLIDNETVHRVKEFTKITDSKENEVITTDHLIRMIYHQDGLFKNALGKRIILINRVDDTNSSQAMNLLEELRKHPLYYKIYQVIIGDLHSKQYLFYGR